MDPKRVCRSVPHWLTRFSLARCTLALLIAAVPAGACVAAPFIPLDWQKVVKTGALAGERKHVNWGLDLDGDYIDDAFLALKPGDKTQVVVQLSLCQERSAILSILSGYGTVAQVGTLVGYAVVNDVPVDLLKALANEPGVAALEFPRPLETSLDTSTRSVMARTSATYSPETFPDAFPGVNGTGVNIAIMDSGVDNAVHGAFPPLVSGYNAITGVAGDPDDDNTCVQSGNDGIANTAAAGDDVQLFPVGQGEANGPCVLAGGNGIFDSALAGDDGVSPFGFISTGANGICNTAALPDDVQFTPVGQGFARRCAIWPGANGTIDSAVAGDDAMRNTFHGTHVASTALGRPGVGINCSAANDGSVPNDCQGMAPGAGLVDVKVANPSGGVNYTHVLDAIEWVWQDGNAHIVNMSFGDNSQADGTDTISQMIDALIANDIAVAVASGNSGGNFIGQTAAASLAVTVANSNDQNSVDRDDDTISATSTFGPRIDFNPGNVFLGMLKPDVTAPGSLIVAARGNSANQYQSLSGTSMASPHVAGAMALLRDLEPELTPGAMKDLLKKTAYTTPAHAAAGASFPAISGQYNVNWGFGLIDSWSAGVGAQTGIADVSFTDCSGPNPGYPAEKPCVLTSDPDWWANSVDVLLATDPPIQGAPNTITLRVENRSTSAAENVTVCVGVKELGVGLKEFYGVGCREVDIAPLATVMVSMPWIPTYNDHQCIQATIDYGFDTQFNNNMTQRNTDPVNSGSPAALRFRVENPLNEPAEIRLVNLPAQTGAFRLYRRLGQNEFREIKPNEEIIRLNLRPENCPVPIEDLVAIPDPAAPIGSTGRLRIAGILRSRKFPEGLQLSGVEFKLTVVAPGLEAAYSIAPHGAEGDVRIPLNLAGVPTSDPRRLVQRMLAVFNVPVKVADPKNLIGPDSVRVVSQGGEVPPYKVSFADGVDSGREILIEFSQPLTNRARYTFDFVVHDKAFQLVDFDGDPLTGDTNFDARVLQGDVNSTGTVTATDVSFVRGRIGQVVLFGDTARSDVNLTGTNTATDVSFVRGRIGDQAP